MDRKKANQILTAILLAVAEMPEGAPEGPMYAALMGTASLEEFQGLVEIAASCGLVTRSGHVLTIAPKGREMVAKIRGFQKARVAS